MVNVPTNKVTGKKAAKALCWYFWARSIEEGGGEHKQEMSSYEEAEGVQSS